MRKIVTLVFFFCTIFSFAQPKTKVACVGDSVTFGYLLENREETSYPAQLQQLLGNQYEVGNFGKNGATLLSKGHRPYIQQEEYQKALDFQADWVIIHLGLNDTDPRNWVNHRDSFIQDYLNLIQEFKNKNPKAKIWICRMTPITPDHPRFISGTRDWYWQIQAAIEQVAQLSNSQLIDLQEVLYNRPDLLPDALHPNTEGASRIAKTVFRALTGNFGGLQLPEIYTDNMVLQRNVPLTIQGIANADEEITISIEKTTQKTEIIQQKSIKTAKNGKWKAVFPSFKAGIDYQMRISSPEKEILLKNIAFGDVFICSGQSNMAFKLNEDANFDKNTDYSNPNIRIFNQLPIREVLAQEWTPEELNAIKNLNYYKSTHWEVVSNENTPLFSAIAYYFGKQIQTSENIPIGLIHNAIGGSNLESWIDRKTLEFEFPAFFNNWKKNDLIMEWVRERASLNIKQSEGTGRHPYEPSYLFASAIVPLQKYAISGVLWYQGESNAHNVETFERLFPIFVKSWRNYWKNDVLPIYFVQLSSINRPTWGYFRDAQRRLNETIPHTFMAISSDVGHPTDVHPKQKKIVAERLAALALHHQYGRKTNPYGAKCTNIVKKANELILSFDNCKTLQTTDNKEVTGFEIAETEGLYFPAKAQIFKKNKIKLSSVKIKNPKFVRYNFAPFANGNLINEQKIPTSTFKEKIN